MTTKRRDVNRSNKFRWELEDLVYLKFDGQDVDPNDEEAQRRIRAEIEQRGLLEAYRERFGEYPAVEQIPGDPWKAIEEAVRTGKKPEYWYPPSGCVI